MNSFPQLLIDLLLLSAASAAAKGSGRPFQAELPNGLSKSATDLDTGDIDEANGSLSLENGSKLSLTFFLIPLLVIVVGTAKGSSLCEVNGSLNPTSLNGSSVNSSSAYRCCCDSPVVVVLLEDVVVVLVVVKEEVVVVVVVVVVTAFVLLLLVFPHASKLSSIEEPPN